MNRKLSGCCGDTPYHVRGQPSPSRWLLAPTLALLASSSCLLGKADIAVSSSHDIEKVGDPIIEEQHKLGRTSTTTESSGEDTVTVTVEREKLCRTSSTQRQWKTTVEEHELKDSGSSKQWGNALLVPTLLGLGLGAAAAPCTRTETDGVGAEVERECTDDEANARLGLGIGLAATAIIPAIFFAVNHGRLSDKRARKPERIITATDWEPCGSVPLAFKDVTLAIGGQVVDRRTSNGDGQVTLSVGSKPQASGSLRVGNETLSISLAGTGVYKAYLAELRARTEATRREAKARARAEQAEAAQRVRRLLEGFKKDIDDVAANKVPFYRAGRAAVLQVMRAPATTRFVSDRITGVCPNGLVITSHEVDSQNGFGALVRSNVCAVTSTVNGASMADAKCEWSVGVTLGTHLLRKGNLKSFKHLMRSCEILGKVGTLAGLRIK